MQRLQQIASGATTKSINEQKFTFRSIRYHLMLKCWNVNSEDRPSFEKLRSLLDDIEAKEGNYVDFTNLSTIKTLPPMKQVQVEAQVHD